MLKLGLLAVAFAATASATTVLVDFNNNAASDNTPNPSGGLYYNNVEGPSGSDQSIVGAVKLNGSTAPLALTNTANALSGWTLCVTNPTSGGTDGASGTAANYFISDS